MNIKYIITQNFDTDLNNSVLPVSCIAEEYKCIDGHCIHKDWLCDLTEDCPHGDDEGPSCSKSFHCECQQRIFLFKATSAAQIKNF